MKNIALIASESVPFIKTGGLADVVGALPKYFDKEAYETIVILPKYQCMQLRWKERLEYVTHFYMDLGWRSQYVGVLTAEYDGVRFYFIDNEYYFAGGRPYGYIHEDVEKFAFFSKAALSALQVIGFHPDIIHCHDWQTGLIPVYLNDSFQQNPFYRGIKTVMTIHNLKFQGIWNLEKIQDTTGLANYFFT
ncbi:MAG: glycogen/starch synthase, partial [Lachnospiraceae bacterium]|nr:glycogen/starch synthase [Lachnospiraceae bacterium]